jgi:hypothetical protein
MEKQRGFPRFKLQSEAAIYTRGSFVRGTVENISMTGLFVSGVQADIQVGDRSEISINLPNVSCRSAVVVDGIAVRVEQRGIAYHFQNIQLETFGLLRAILHNKSLLSQAAA